MRLPFCANDLLQCLQIYGLFARMDPHVIEEVPGLLKYLSAVVVLALEQPPVPIRLVVLFEVDLKSPIEAANDFRYVESVSRERTFIEIRLQVAR